jgi:hypothetical protein
MGFGAKLSKICVTTTYISYMITSKRMQLTSTTYKNKTYELKSEDDKLYMGDVEMKDVKHVYFSPCSLRQGDAYLLFVFNTAPQKDGKKEYFFRRNWLKKPITKSDDDIQVVNELNDAMMTLTNSVELKDGFQGRVDRTFSHSAIWVRDNAIISVEAKLYIPLDTVGVIFLERLTSYTRSFDVTLIMGTSTFSISAIQRKMYLASVKKAFRGKELYETGPDPIPWDSMFKRKKEDNLDWKDMHKLITEQESEEEDVSDWAPGNTDESEEEDYDYPEEDDYDENELKEDIYEDDVSDEYSEEEEEYERPNKRIKK